MTTLEIKLDQKCALCGDTAFLKGIQSRGLDFCCHGCMSVYQILESQKQLDQKENHPLLRQAARYGLISNPRLVEELQAKEKRSSQDQIRWVLEIEEMWCPACADFIHLVLGQQRGVICATIDYITDLGAIQFDPKITSKEAISKLILELGYKVKELGGAPSSINAYIGTRLIVAAFLSLNIMMFTYPLYATYFDIDLEGFGPLLAWVSFGLTLPVIFYSATPIYKRVIAQIRQGILGMESLVTLGIASAMLLSFYEMVIQTYHVYFDTVSVLIAFLLLGKLIESKAKFSTKSALMRLHHALPRKGRRQEADGTLSFVPLKEVKVGDLLVAYTGEKIVLDGVIVKGEGALDESLLTGESLPNFKGPQDQVLSGTVLQTGNLVYKALVKEEGSTLHKILTLVEQDVGHKSVYVRAADQIVKWFAPLVLSLAFLAFMFAGSFTEGMVRAIGVLLIACPCAIGIAAPLVESEVIRRFSEKGAIVRNRALLALLPKVTHFIFDKTGTLTYGRFEVLSGLEGLTDEELSKLRGLCQSSLHPVSKAIEKAISNDPFPFDRVREIAGRGMEGEGYFLGSEQFILEKGLNPIPRSSSNPLVYFFTEERILSVITLGDSIREGAQECLKSLSPNQRILLSGDHPLCVEEVANKLPIDAWYAEKSPLEKQSMITKLKGEGSVVAMCGDGINDAPSLAKADVGISLLSASDISIQVSDLLLTSDQLTLLPELITLSKRGQKLIGQNLFWAFFYNVLGIALAAFGLLSPLFASFAMIVSSLIVLLNAKRL